MGNNPSAEQALDKARKQAASEKLNITYEQSDLNFICLKEEKYDFVTTQNCLHHVLNLEHLASEIHQLMTTDGTLWIHDYIGETQFQYSHERLEIVNFILSILPERMHYDVIKIV